jgi:hypothetical protein
VSPAKARAGERLPYLLSKLKAPRVLQRLEQTAERARTEQWPYEQFLETLLEAEVFARDASGARMRIRAAGFPSLKTLEDFDWSAQPSAERPLVLHLAQLAWIEEQANVCFLGPPGTGKTHCETPTGPSWVAVRVGTGSGRDDSKDSLSPSRVEGFLAVDLSLCCCRCRPGPAKLA